MRIQRSLDGCARVLVPLDTLIRANTYLALNASVCYKIVIGYAIYRNDDSSLSKCTPTNFRFSGTLGKYKGITIGNIQRYTSGDSHSLGCPDRVKSQIQVTVVINQDMDTLIVQVEEPSPCVYTMLLIRRK